MNNKAISWVQAQGSDYKKVLSQVESAFQQSSLVQMTYYHDDWCGIYDGRPCNCDPDVVVVPLTDESA